MVGIGPVVTFGLTESLVALITLWLFSRGTWRKGQIDEGVSEMLSLIVIILYTVFLVKQEGGLIDG